MRRLDHDIREPGIFQPAPHGAFAVAAPTTGLGGVVLCGGASTRMGAVKATLPTPSGPLAGIPARALAAAGCGSVVAVGGDASVMEPLARTLGIGWIPDEWPGQGPLGGVATACARLTGQTLLVCACDLPWIDRAAVVLDDVALALLHRLRHVGRREGVGVDGEDGGAVGSLRPCHGVGEVGRTVFSVPEGTLGYWQKRFGDEGVTGLPTQLTEFVGRVDQNRPLPEKVGVLLKDHIRHGEHERMAWVHQDGPLQPRLVEGLNGLTLEANAAVAPQDRLMVAAVPAGQAAVTLADQARSLRKEPDDQPGGNHKRQPHADLVPPELVMTKRMNVRQGHVPHHQRRVTDER